MPLEILDSEDDGVFNDDDHSERLPPNPSPPLPSFPAELVLLGPPSSGALNQSESSRKLQHVPTSGGKYARIYFCGVWFSDLTGMMGDNRAPTTGNR
jgi:hypothetical protein